MKYILSLIFLVGCSNSDTQKFKAAECFCSNHGGIKFLISTLKCHDGTEVFNSYLSISEMCK